MTDFTKDYSDQYDEEVDSLSIDPDKEDARPHRFKLVPFGEINLSTEPNYLIKGIVPRTGLTVIWGPPKCGKSFKCLDMFMSVARNVRYRDHKVKGGPVVYIALEGHRGFEARMEGYPQHGMDGKASVQFYLVGGTLDLVKDHAELIACIQAQIGDSPPAAVVIDTLNRSLSGSESSDTDMSAYIKAADAVRDAFACAVAIVHHCGHDTTRPRGHTSLFGAADCMISVKRDAANNIVTTIQHMKDGEPGEPMVDRLESVTVGTDDDGDPITTCIVKPIDGQAVEPDTRKRGSDRDVLAMEALTEALLNHARLLPASLMLPNGTKGCTLDQWRDELYARSILERDKGTSREKFSRLRERLTRKRMIGIRNDFVWLVKPEGAADFTPDL
jgi:KaiC/GvpD/RAD55 family RecA-like ATPase